MRLSPLNIKRQEFSKKMKGYDIKEVAAFLERIAEEVEVLQNENEEMKKELDNANGKIGEFRKIEKSLQETLMRAQDSSAKSMESAKKQSAMILKEAEIKASQIIEKAKITANELKNSVEHLKEEKDIIIAKLRAIVNSQINIVDRTFNEQSIPAEVPVQKPAQQSLDIDINEIINKISE